MKNICEAKEKLNYEINEITNPGLFLGPASLDWCRWGNQQLAGVDWSQRRDGATSPHIHVGGLLQLLGDGDVGGGYSCIGTWLARRRRIH